MCETDCKHLPRPPPGLAAKASGMFAEDPTRSVPGRPDIAGTGGLVGGVMTWGGGDERGSWAVGSSCTAATLTHDVQRATPAEAIRMQILVQDQDFAM